MQESLRSQSHLNSLWLKQAINVFRFAIQNVKIKIRNRNRNQKSDAVGRVHQFFWHNQRKVIQDQKQLLLCDLIINWSCNNRTGIPQLSLTSLKIRARFSSQHSSSQNHVQVQEKRERLRHWWKLKQPHIIKMMTYIWKKVRWHVKAW